MWLRVGGERGRERESGFRHRQQAMLGGVDHRGGGVESLHQPEQRRHCVSGRLPGEHMKQESVSRKYTGVSGRRKRVSRKHTCASRKQVSVSRKNRKQESVSRKHTGVSWKRKRVSGKHTRVSLTLHSKSFQIQNLKPCQPLIPKPSALRLHTNPNERPPSKQQPYTSGNPKSLAILHFWQPYTSGNPTGVPRL